uniref:methylated diphthine methylhydrolase n=1 Tax=Albugo laibachii Nc14 TaxID=890382 RepID=F0W3X2_9STRA|nr:conserved hypothetical protein [Albugo laibachii Nc14]|eukprot:CCA15767.1 conserved hypothetical protein [Albugo laibachii Nc14]
MATCESILKFDTAQTADCVEACPVSGHEATMVVATYQLNTNDFSKQNMSTGGLRPSQSGTLQQYCVLTNELDTHGDIRAAKVQDVELDYGVLDAKWSSSPLHDNVVLALATSNGSVEFFTLAETFQAGKRVELLKKMSWEVTLQEDKNSVCGNPMCLSVDWSNRAMTSTSPFICASFADGKIAVWQISNQTISLESEWQGHNLHGAAIESWISAFDCFNPNIIFTGADDCTLKGWDKRSTEFPTFISRHHTMGVCSIQFHPGEEHLCAVGSYDEVITLWDTRQMKNPLSEYHAGGGVWRLKWNPHLPNLLLAACMHNGFQIVSSKSGSPPAIHCHYTEHGSLAYGVDWWNPKKPIMEYQIVGSCSFYDKEFHLWRCNTTITKLLNQVAFVMIHASPLDRLRASSLQAQILGKIIRCFGGILLREVWAVFPELDHQTATISSADLPQFLSTFTYFERRLQICQLLQIEHRSVCFIKQRAQVFIVVNDPLSVLESSRPRCDTQKIRALCVTSRS